MSRNNKYCANLRNTSIHSIYYKLRGCKLFMRNILNTIDKFLEYLLILLLSLLVIVVFFQVINRFILHIPAAWTQEIGQYVFVWVSTIGIAIALRKKAHIGLTIIVNMFPKNFRKIINLITKLIMLSFYLIIMHGGFLFARAGYMESTDSLQWLPMFYVYVAIPLSALFMTIFSIVDIYEFILSIKK
jgi:TRAP-type C4-dicarboxylate transport system permease small subunit